MKTSPIIRAPKPGTKFLRVKDRLALYHQNNEHSSYWAQYWSDDLMRKYLRNLAAGRMDEFEHYAFRFLKPDDVILEAGCGNGQMVEGLVRRGFGKVLGIDYEPGVIRQVQTVLPHLNVKVDNVFSLNIADNFLDAYLSFGVVEHFFSGPQPILNEARRVLRKGGVAMISVPHLNPYRGQALAQLPEAHTEQLKEGFRFHQYYFDEMEFSLMLKESGLTVLETFPYGVSAFLTREHSLFLSIWDSILLRNPLRRPLRSLMYHAPMRLRRACAHMNMFICRRDE